MRRIATISLLSLILFSACDRGAPMDNIQIDNRNAAMLDGSAGGNAHFFFLPPMVTRPQFNGSFNPDLSPTVEVCRNTAQDAAGHCITLIDSFDRITPKNGQLITVDPADEHYVVDWDARGYAVEGNIPFRVVVLAGDQQLGYIDLIKIAGVYRNANTNAVLSRTGIVKIRFRIEDGALCDPNATECFEAQVGPSGGTFTITRNDGTVPAGTEFPNGALSETVNLVIERVVSGECLPTDVPQYRGCYRFTTEPHVENFNLQATVGVCMEEAAGVPFFNDGQLRLWKWSEVTGEPIEELERVIVDYLVCPTPTSIGTRPVSPLLLGAARAGSWLLKPIAAVFGPNEAYATMIGYEGGKLGNFSVVGWVRPLKVSIKDGDNQTGAAGAQLPAQLRMRVVNKYGETEMGAAGLVVDYLPSSDGIATPPSTFTNHEGVAFARWTLATQPGANTLRARVATSRAIAPVPYEAEAVFNAIGQ